MVDFDVLSKKLGKRKSHRREYVVLEFMCDTVEDGEVPRSLVWLNDNLERVIGVEPFSLGELRDNAVVVHKVVMKCWGNGQVDGVFGENFICRGVMPYQEKTGRKLNYDNVSYDEARDLLNYLTR